MQIEAVIFRGKLLALETRRKLFGRNSYAMFLKVKGNVGNHGEQILALIWPGQ